MNKETVKFESEDLLKNICEIYGYDVKFENNKVICINDDLDECEFDNVELALIDWLETLIESEKQYIAEGAEVSLISEIDYIKEIKNNLMYNPESISLKDCLSYGEVPENMKKKLSVFLDEKIEKSNKFEKMVESGRFTFNAQKVSLPVEFVLNNNELSYIKIPNNLYLEKILFENDYSEIEPYEVDVYNKSGLMGDIPLLPSNSLSKFELSVPVIVIISNERVRIHSNIDYISLF